MHQKAYFFIFIFMNGGFCTEGILLTWFNLNQIMDK